MSVRTLTFLIATALAPHNHASIDLFGGLADGWRKNWGDQRLFSKPTLYDVVMDDGRPVLHAASDSANAGLIRKLRVKAPSTAVLRWRWKIKESLVANTSERKRSGDDYAARICVVFETSIIPLRTRSIHYVWAAHQSEGTVYPSPYSSNVGMFVLRSGEDDAGSWQAEQRDVLADYEKYFGEEPTVISGVAVMVDTDNTGLSGEAWFSDLHLESDTR